MYEEILLVIAERNQKKTNGLPVLGRSWSMSWHNFLPKNTNQNISVYQKHLPLMSLEKKVAYERLQLKHKHLLV